MSTTQFNACQLIVCQLIVVQFEGAQMCDRPMSVHACQLRQLIVCPRVLEYDGIHVSNMFMFNVSLTLDF
jgi:hypothetical protein